MSLKHVMLCGVLLWLGCGGRQNGDGELPGGPTCGRLTAAHGLVNVSPGATTCLMNSECNISPKPACAAPSDNLCACTSRNAAGTCTSGRCVWHPDPAILSCVCVPGALEACTTSGGAAGIQTCNATGTAWAACT